MKDIGMPGMIRIDRNRMRKLCSTNIPIRYGKSLHNITYGAGVNGVALHIQDGTTSGDIVIGADGAR